MKTNCQHTKVATFSACTANVTAIPHLILEIHECLEIIKGMDPCAITATISVRGLNHQVSKQSLRSLRVGWMYKSSSNLWLTDEVF